MCVLSIAVLVNARFYRTQLLVRQVGDLLALQTIAVSLSRWGSDSAIFRLNFAPCPNVNASTYMTQVLKL